MGLLRPARPQGAAPLHRARAGELEGHLQLRARLGRGDRPRGRAGLALPRHSPALDVRRGGQRRPVPRGPAAARRLRPRLLLPPVAGAAPRARPRRAGHPDPAGPGVLRGEVRRAVPAGALRPGVRPQPRRGDGELGMRDVRRRAALPHPADPPAAPGPRRVRLPRDGPHVVRRPRHDALVGRPVAQRGLRVLGGQLGAGQRQRVHRDLVELPRALQAHRLRDGHGPRRPPDPRRGPRRLAGDGQLRRDHLRQGPERAPPARRLHRRGRLRLRAADLLRAPLVGQHRSSPT